MRTRFPRVVVPAMLAVWIVGLGAQQAAVDWPVVAKIREEGLQRSRVMDLESYMADVLGARLTLSQDMKRAQAWAQAEMGRVGLTAVTAEPFMDYGVSWDNEYTSLHMLEPDYTPMVAYPLAHTPGTNGRQTAPALFADIQSKADIQALAGTLKGAVVLITPPVTIDLAPLVNGVPRRTEEELRKLEQVVIAPTRPPAPRAAPNPASVTPAERMAFFKAEGVVAVLQCDSGWIGAVRGFARPGANADKWSREATLASPPIVAVTPEHYNRLYRILKRGVPARVEIDVRNRIGERVEKAVNLIGDIPGTDLRDEIVMIGAHFDTWHASPNASDNTSGVAVVLEAARILTAVGAKPRRTIRVALWSGEEQGIHGSREYVHAHFGNPNDPKIGAKPAYEKFSAYFNQDYGAGQYRGIYLQGNEHARRLLTAWMAPFADFGMTAVSNQSVGSTDHVPFDNAGLPGFQFLQDRIPGTGGHTNLDFVDTIQAEDLMKNAVVMASYAYHAAVHETRVPRKSGK
jgi:carboxypeptidase Q